MRSILLAATALAMLSGAAYAQTSTSGSNSTAVNSSGSQSSSVSSPRVNVIGNPIGNGASSSTSGASANVTTRSSSQSAAIGNSSTNANNSRASSNGNSSTNTLRSASSGNSTSTTTTINLAGTSDGSSGSGATGATSGSGTTRNEQYVGYGGSYTVRNTPEVIPPSIVGGNACAVGASGGLSLPGFGIAAGATWADKACERRQQAALLFNMGEQRIALELMCQDENVRSAMRVGGKPCIADTAQAQAPVAAAAPVTVAAVTAAPEPRARTTPRPDWCTRAAPTTEASRAYVAQVCGG